MTVDKIGAGNGAVAIYTGPGTAPAVELLQLVESRDEDKRAEGNDSGRGEEEGVDAAEPECPPSGFATVMGSQSFKSILLARGSFLGGPLRPADEEYDEEGTPEDVEKDLVAVIAGLVDM